MKRLWVALLVAVARFAYRHAAPPGKRKPVGIPYNRDPEHPCEAYEPRPRRLGYWSDCATDGHYLCKECCHRDPQLDEEETP